MGAKESKEYLPSSFCIEGTGLGDVNCQVVSPNNQFIGIGFGKETVRLYDI